MLGVRSGLDGPPGTIALVMRKPMPPKATQIPPMAKSAAEARPAQRPICRARSWTRPGLHLDREEGGAVQHDHGDRQEAAEKREGGEQTEQAAFVEAAEVAIQPQGHALQDIADGDAEHE